MACHNLGMDLVGACEIDTKAREIYKRHFPDMPVWEDATKLNPSELPDFDLLVASCPCQSFSNAGKRGGISDARGQLFFEVMRVCESKQPRHILFENVPGLLSIDSGEVMRTILRLFDELHYDTTSSVFDAANFTAQSRKRVFITGRLRTS